MKITTTRSQLLAALNAVRHAISERTTLPVLSCVLLKTDGGNLAVTGTNLDITIQGVISAKVERPGALRVPLAPLLKIVSLAGQDIELEHIYQQGDFLTVRSDGNTCNLAGMAASEFPNPLAVKPEKHATITQVALRDLLARTAFAMSCDESRYVLCGMHLTSVEQKLRAVATDGRRIVVVDSSAQSDLNCVVPAQTIKCLAEIISDGSAVDIMHDAQSILFLFTTDIAVSVISKLIDMQYPNYKQVIPVENSIRIVVQREDLLRAIKWAAAVHPNVSLSLDHNKLAVSGESKTGDTATHYLTINYSGKPFKIIICASYLTDFLAIVTASEVVIEFSDNLNPAVIKADGVTYVVMPLRTS